MRRRREQGQSTIELAVLMPLLLMMAFACVEFGTVFVNYMDITSATRDAARRAASARAEPDPSGAVRRAFDGSLDRYAPSSVTMSISGAWRADTRMTITGSAPAKVDVLGMVVWSGTLKAESVVRLG